MSIEKKTGGEHTIASDSTETFFLKVVLFVVGSCASVLISRGLGPEGRGEYYLPIVAAAVMITAGKLGLEQANVFLLGTKGISIDRLLGQSGLVTLVAGGLGVVLLLLIPWVLPLLFKDVSVIFLLLAGLTIPFSIHTQLSAGLLTLEGRVTWQFLANLAASAIQVVLLLSLFILGWLEVWLVLAVNLASIVLTWALTILAFDNKKNEWILWDIHMLRESLKHSVPLYLGMILFFLHLRADMFMLKGMIGTEALGQYSLSVALAETVLLATDSLAIAIIPRQMEGTLKNAAFIALQGARISSLLSVAISLVWTVAGFAVIRIFFGQEFAPAYIPLIGLLPGMIFLGMQRACGGPALRSGMPWKITAIYASSLLFNIALNFWLIPVWGPFGAALASSFSYGIGATLFLVWTTRLAEASLSKALVPGISDILSIRRAATESIKILQRRLLTKKRLLKT